MTTRSHEMLEPWVATNFHATFSARVFEDWYVVTGRAPEPFVKTRGTVVSSRIAATEEVRIKRFRVFPCSNAEFRIDVVPRTADMMSSRSAKQVFREYRTYHRGW
jgi:hypothetical protein